jgi:hypothetical protein
MIGPSREIRCTFSHLPVAGPLTGLCANHAYQSLSSLDNRTVETTEGMGLTTLIRLSRPGTGSRQQISERPPTCPKNQLVLSPFVLPTHPRSPDRDKCVVNESLTPLSHHRHIRLFHLLDWRVYAWCWRVYAWCWRVYAWCWRVYAWCWGHGVDLTRCFDLDKRP